MTQVHPTAIIHPSAQIDEGVQIGPHSVVGPEVVIGAGTVLHNHVTIQSLTTAVADEFNELERVDMAAEKTAASRSPINPTPAGISVTM